jgi:hypothetical protein
MLYLIDVKFAKKGIILRSTGNNLIRMPFLDCLKVQGKKFLFHRKIQISRKSKK